MSNDFDTSGVQPTQKQQVLSHIAIYGSITAIEAVKHYNLMRLAAIIGFLKDDGYEFDHSDESSIVSGKKKHYRRYWILKSDRQESLPL